MKVLVVGGGGREHAIMLKLVQSPKVTEVIAAPGNPGMALLGRCVDIGAPSPDGVNELADFAKAEGIELTVVGPESYLEAGISDVFEKRGLRCFGASKAAAELETSKVFSKELMAKYGIPTASYRVFEDAEEAIKYIKSVGTPVVVKADGLAAGKGAVVCPDLASAEEAVRDMLDNKVFGNAGSRVVVEEFMRGTEATLLAFTDGETVVPMVSSQDHKQAYDGDKGPNTGGMGTIAPVPAMTPQVTSKAFSEILLPVVRAMKAEGRTYKGVLYAGLMLTEDGPKVIEFNCRFGDPEAQVVLALLKTDLVEICNAVLDGTLSELPVEWYDKHAACVVLASGGYPGHYGKGYVIDGLDQARESGLIVIHAGTALDKEGQVVTAGGRVLGLVATGSSLKRALEEAYRGAAMVSFEGVQYRKDIGHHSL